MSNRALKILAGAGGTASEPAYVEDVFQTHLYAGTGSQQDIDNGLDLSGDGGLVWIKSRTSTENHALYDSERGINPLSSNTTGDEPNVSTKQVSMLSNGFRLATDGLINSSGNDYVSWSFLKKPGFFDVQEYTGGNNTIYHNLGCKPGLVIIKQKDGTSNWGMYCRDGSNDSEIGIAYLNNTDAFTTGAISFSATDTFVRVFSSSFNFDATTSGNEYVVYLFAMGGTDTNAQKFGEDQDESIIKCGKYTGNGSSSGVDVDVGFEPQFLFVKMISHSGYYGPVVDVMRGLTYDTNGDEIVWPNVSGAESAVNQFSITSTGFKAIDTNNTNMNGRTYFYMAIRRPHKPASEFTATDMFKPIVGTNSSDWVFDAGFPVDLHFYSKENNYRFVFDRVRGDEYLQFNSNSAGTGYTCDFDKMNYCDVASSTSNGWTLYNFKRVPGFFDIVRYIGTGSLRTVTHNLGVVPEFMIIKRTDSSGNWIVYHSTPGATKYAPAFRTDPFYSSSDRWGNTTPTSSVFTVSIDSDVNGSTGKYIAYLFATSPGISKVGSYSGNAGNDINVDCGFSAGARFVLIKRSDTEIQGSQGSNWYLWDSARGIVSGDDPYFLLNSTTYNNSTDYIDPLSSGFTVTGGAPNGLNANGGTYIFLAIA